MHESSIPFDPPSAFAKELSAYEAASQRAIGSTWRQLSKTCMRVGISPWPLTDANIEFAVRRWIECGVTGKALKVRHWALRRLQEFENPGGTLAVLATATWERLVWSSVPRRQASEATPRLTVFETRRLIDGMAGTLDLQWLRVLIVLIDMTGVPLRTLLRLRQRDMSEAALTLHHRTHTYVMPLEDDDARVLQSFRSSSAADAFIFSCDGGASPLSAHRVNRELGRFSLSILGRMVSTRAIQEAAIRFLLQLGIALKSLSDVTGLTSRTLIRVSGLRADARDICLLTRYGVQVSSKLPVFVDLYLTLQRADAPLTGARDRAILSLLYFNFATPAMVCAMNRDDVHDDGSYSMPRGSDLQVTLEEDHVVKALGDWVAIRGSAPGPLFLSKGHTGMRRMTPQVIERTLIERTRSLRHGFTAASLRLAGMTRAANAGLPLAQLADLADMTYTELATALGLHQRIATTVRVACQIEALHQARLSHTEYSALCRRDLLHPYIHAGSP